jgi:hypothetical protein
MAAEPSDEAALNAVIRTIQPTLDKLKPEAKVEYPENSRSVRVLYLPQSFKVHGRSMTGEIAAVAHDEIGPSFKGFVLTASLQRKGEANQAVIPQTLTDPYWRTNLDVTPLGKTDKQIFWRLSYGSRMDEKILAEIRDKLKSLNDLAN